MEYQKIVNLLDNKPNQLSKCRTTNCNEINDQSSRRYAVNSEIRSKTMLKSSSCKYADACILVTRTITNTGIGGDDAARQVDEIDKEVKFKNFAPFINCKSEINNAEIDNANDIDIVMPIYNLIKYSANYSKTS